MKSQEINEQIYVDLKDILSANLITNLIHQLPMIDLEIVKNNQ